MTTKFISAYGPKTKVDLMPSGISGAGAKQSFKKECDINHIMAKYQKTGLVTHLAKHQPEYGHASAIQFSDAMQTVAQAEQIFAELPSTVRSRFHGDPAEFLIFCENPENRSEASILGLLDEVEAIAPTPASDSASAPLAPNPADVEPSHESA